MNERQGARAERAPALLLENVTKTFPGVLALDRVSFEVAAGTVHGLVGQNGSGKSTLVGILGGRHAPDPATRIELFGEPLPYQKPWAIRQLGIAVIHQELMILPDLSAAENIFLGEYERVGPFVDRATMAAQFRSLSERFGVRIDPQTPAGRLSVAEQALIEIMREVRRETRVLLMDEPTATLGLAERERLYSVVRNLREHGTTIVFIAHDLDEVLQLSDAVTVFRDGKHVRTAARSEWTKRRLVDAMLGGAAGEELAAALAAELDKSAAGASTPAVDGPPLLSVRGLRVEGALGGVDLDVRAGEIVGIAGLVGSGRSTLVRAIAGAEQPAAGTLELDGKPVRWPRTVSAALRLGIALVPEDRKRQGLVLELPAYDNVAVSDFWSVARGGFLVPRILRRQAAALLEQVSFRGRIDAPARTLSGGNQQKVVFAKWLHRTPRVFLVDEPTRGVDVGAKREMLRVIRKLAAGGAGVVLISSELEEVAAAAHRVVLMSDGAIVGELRGAEITMDAILASLFRAGSHEEVAV
jgi:ABC-type sugar transport system ATPase subunit